MDSIPQKTAIERCIKALEDAKNDNEKMAALLLVTRIVKVKELDAYSTKQIYEAVGFEFVNRLFATKSVPKGCHQSVYLSLALTVLACFASDQELAIHPHMTNKIQIVLDIILKKYQFSSDEREDDIQDLKEDCYAILSAISCSPEGCSVLANNGVIKDLLTFIETNMENSKQALELLLKLLQTAPKHPVVVQHYEDITRLIDNLAKHFEKSPTEIKFTLCEMLTDLLSCSNELFLFIENPAISSISEVNLKLIRKGLMDILQSKAADSQKAQAISLASAVMDIYGIKWTLSKYPNEDTIYSKKFLLLLVSLVSVEMNTFYDGTNNSANVTYLPCLISCFNIIEKVIIHLCNSDRLDQYDFEDDSNTVNSSLIIKLHSALKDCIFGIIQFLTKISQEKKHSHTVNDVIVIGCVRTLCAWMSEETLALKDDFSRVIPFLLTLAKQSFEHVTHNTESESSSVSRASPNLLQFLLPVLCHLSADDGSREIILKEEFQITLNKYFVYLLDHVKKDKNSAVSIYESIETLIGVFLNLAVTEKDLTKYDASLIEIRSVCFAEVDTIFRDTMQVTLLANMITLALILTRAQIENIATGSKDRLYNFFVVSFQILITLCPFNINKTFKELSVEASGKWDEFSELWFIGVDNFIACIPVVPRLTEILKQSEEFETLLKFIQDQDISAQDGSTLEVIVSLRSLVENILRY